MVEGTQFILNELPTSNMLTKAGQIRKLCR